MKKIYSFVLMAAALLIGTNVWADDIVVVNHSQPELSDSFADLQAAIDAIPAGDSATITLNANVQLDKSLLIPNVPEIEGGILNVDGQKINLDLNGHNITGNPTKAGFGCIALFKGKLDIKGSGMIQRNAKKGSNNPAKSAITIYGAPWSKANVVWSELNIGPNVSVHSNEAGTNGVYGLCLQNTSALPAGVSGLGYSTYTSGQNCGKSNAGCAYGVKILIEGKVYGWMRGINILGTINANPICDGYAEDGSDKQASYPFYADHKYPYINIASTAEVWCGTGIEDNGNGGIYGGGFAICEISGYVHGQTGILAKAGDYAVNSGIIASDSEDSGYNANYHGTVAGSGIFVASDKSYPGEVVIQLTGDTKVSGNGGSAIATEVATNNGSVATLGELVIEGATIVPGADGAISLIEEDAQHVEVTGVNISGSITVKDSETGEVTEQPVTNFVPEDAENEYHATEVDGVIVVTKGEAPEGQEAVAGHDGEAVNWKHNDASVLPMKETISESLTLAELEINQAYKQTLTIAAGEELTVGRVILGANAQIIVKAGAKLIVTGEQGIVANTVNNIILETSKDAQAIFLFNPKVKSNRHPNATVELTTYSWYENASSYQWHRFGVPTHTALQSIACLAPGVVSQLQVFVNPSWQNLGFLGDGYSFDASKLNKPFATYNLIANRLPGADAPKYRLAGELVGNENAALKVDMLWTPFTNSYMAEIDLDAMLGGLASSVEKYVYIATPAGLGTYTWTPLDEDALEEKDIYKLQPMQAFILRNMGSEAEVNTINYASMVWAPAAAPAPRRRVAANDYTAKVRVIVANEQGLYDDVTLRENAANTKAIEKYMNDDVNIYAMAEEKSAIVVSEDIKDTYLGFSTVKGGDFTISFANVEGREFDLVDTETGAVVPAMEGATYQFHMNQNSASDYRFKLVERNNAPTAIENAEAVKSAKGIYTITGQYVGEMNVWSTLPAGVYVVDGAKRVK